MGKAPIYKMQPAEVELILHDLQRRVPDMLDRVAEIAERNIGAPYQLGLLGEFPFQINDKEPLFPSGRADCVVFVEQVYAMALASDWQTFFALLQRIRYAHGEISVLKRNHFILADWNKNNNWLLEDITGKVSGTNLQPMVEIVDRSRFFRKNYSLSIELPVETCSSDYVPAEFVDAISGKLMTGDCVDVIRRRPDGTEFCGHMGLIIVDGSGQRWFIESTEPQVKKTQLSNYIECQRAHNVGSSAGSQNVFLGMKFLRPRADALRELVKLDGPDAPVVTAPRGLVARQLLVTNLTITNSSLEQLQKLQ